jgi:hypothetical protein
VQTCRCPLCYQASFVGCVFDVYSKRQTSLATSTSANKENNFALGQRGLAPTAKDIGSQYDCRADRTSKAIQLKEKMVPRD